MNYGEVFQTLLQLIHYRPNELAEKANPEHPEVALAALREWKERQINLAGREWRDFIAGQAKPEAPADEDGAESPEVPEAEGGLAAPDAAEGSPEEGGEA